MTGQNKFWKILRGLDKRNLWCYYNSNNKIYDKDGSCPQKQKQRRASPAESARLFWRLLPPLRAHEKCDGEASVIRLSSDPAMPDKLGGTVEYDTSSLYLG